MKATDKAAERVAQVLPNPIEASNHVAARLMATPPAPDSPVGKSYLCGLAGLDPEPELMTPTEHKARSLWWLAFVANLRRCLGKETGRDLRSVGGGYYQLAALDDGVPLAEEDFFGEVTRSAGKFTVKASNADKKLRGDALKVSREAQARVAWVESIARRASGKKGS
jgi:hypothetical protein